MKTPLIYKYILNNTQLVRVSAEKDLGVTIMGTLSWHTVRPICQPYQNQGIVYNGHKRAHGLKYQSVALPNGMIANMYGPVGNFIIEVINLKF